MSGTNFFDGISEAHRSTWSRLTDLRAASIAVQPHALRDDETDCCADS
jgi:hypothetical protein